MTTLVMCDGYHCDSGYKPDDQQPEGWLHTPDGQDWCSWHRPCRACGHEHMGVCRTGEKKVWEVMTPGRTMADGTPIDYLVSGNYAIVEQGCGCPAWQGWTP